MKTSDVAYIVITRWPTSNCEDQFEYPLFDYSCKYDDALISHPTASDVATNKQILVLNYNYKLPHKEIKHKSKLSERK